MYVTFSVCFFQLMVNPVVPTLRILQTGLMLLRVKTSNLMGSTPHPHFWKCLFLLSSLLPAFYPHWHPCYSWPNSMSRLRAFALALVLPGTAFAQVLMTFSLIPLGYFFLQILNKSSPWRPPIKCQLPSAITSSCYPSSPLWFNFFSTSYLRLAHNIILCQFDSRLTSTGGMSAFFLFHSRCMNTISSQRSKKVDAAFHYSLYEREKFSLHQVSKFSNVIDMRR